MGPIPGLGRSLGGGGHGNPLQYSCLENPHGWRWLMGYNPWGCKESDVTERLSTVQHHMAVSGCIFTNPFRSSLGWKDPLEKEMTTHFSTFAGKSHGQRSLVGYSSRDCKELETTEQLHFHFQIILKVTQQLDVRTVYFQVMNYNRFGIQANL